MAKKTFIENPALQFISAPEPEQEANLSQSELRAIPVPPGYKRNPAIIETRNRRVQLLTTKSMYQKLKERAEQEHCSVNDLVNRILEEGIDG